MIKTQMDFRLSFSLISLPRASNWSEGLWMHFSWYVSHARNSQALLAGYNSTDNWGRLALALSNFFCSFFKITFSSGDLLLVFEPTHSFCAGQRRAVRSELQPHSTLWRSGWNDCHCCNHFKSSTSSSKWSCCCWWPSSKLLLFLLLGVTRLECMLPMVIVVIISKSSPCLPPPNNPAGGGAHHYDVSPCCSMEVGTRGWRSGSRLWTVESFGGWRSGQTYSWVFGRWANYIGRCKNYFGRWGN